MLYVIYTAFSSSFQWFHPFFILFYSKFLLRGGEKCMRFLKVVGRVTGLKLQISIFSLGCRELDPAMIHSGMLLLPRKQMGASKHRYRGATKPLCDRGCWFILAKACTRPDPCHQDPGKPDLEACQRGPAACVAGKRSEYECFGCMQTLNALLRQLRE